MLMATYNDFFNVDKNIKSPDKFNEDSKSLKNQILKSVKTVIEDEKKQSKINENK